MTPDLVYILGVRERSDKLVRDLVLAVLADPAPFIPLTIAKRGTGEPRAGKPGQPMPSALPFRPMTLGNMRELGVRSLAVTCELCHHEAVLPADECGDPVPAFRPQMGRSPIPNFYDWISR